DAVVVSPLVEIFRSGYTEGYAFLPESTVLCGVVSVAMYNKNPQVKDSPVDAPPDIKVYREGVRQKFRALIAGALDTGADVLVCPDIGCGVFENDPLVVGALFGEVLREDCFRGRLREVVLTGQFSFAEAAQIAFSGQSLGEPPAALEVRNQLASFQLTSRAAGEGEGSRRTGGQNESPQKANCSVC
ncbi:unnamed protein product, partial [Polarella glacialis]